MTPPATKRRLEAAIEAARSAGAALMTARRQAPPGRLASYGQLKTVIDQAAEGWVLGYLRGLFPRDAFLCEELYDSAGGWQPASSFWTIDALDGTMSYMDGYDGFCVQAAYVSRGVVQLGVVHEPAAGATYFASRGAGAYRMSAKGRERLRLPPAAAWPARPIFVDSKRPKGEAGALFSRLHGRFLECGSFGLKICRVAEGSAQLFAKPAPFKLWDTAPGQAILEEAGGRMGLWDGAPVPYDGRRIIFDGLLAAPRALFERAVAELKRKPGDS